MRPPTFWSGRKKMREIKFRALVQHGNDKPNWEYYRALSMPWWLDTALPSPVKVIVKDLQFICLKDKNGKEIYEGDIVFYKYDWKSLEDPFKNRWEVQWGYDGWVMRRGERETGDQNCGDDPHYNRWEECEIIGNIYENPNLLTTRQHGEE